MPLTAQSAIALVPLPPATGQVAQLASSHLLNGSTVPEKQVAHGAFSDIFARGMSLPSPGAPLPPGGQQTQQPTARTVAEPASQGPGPLDDNPVQQALSPDSPDVEQMSGLAEATSPLVGVEQSAVMPLLPELGLAMFAHQGAAISDHKILNGQEDDLSPSPVAVPGQPQKTAMQLPDGMTGALNAPEAQPGRPVASHVPDPRQKLYGGLNTLLPLVSGQTDVTLPPLIADPDLVPGPELSGDRLLPKRVPDHLPTDRGGYQHTSQVSTHVVTPASVMAVPAPTSDIAFPVDGLIAPVNRSDLPVLETGKPVHPVPSDAAVVSVPTIRDQAPPTGRHLPDESAQVSIIPVDDLVPRSDEVPSHPNPGTSSTAVSAQLPGSAVAITVMPRPLDAETSIVPMIATPPAPLRPEPKITSAAADKFLVEDLAALPSGPMATQPRSDVMEVRTVVPRPVVQQLLDASIRAIERPVELHLSPEELGRVRISMTFSEASVILNVHAERAETLELLRRHSEQLAQELRELGYGMISFSFGQRNRGQDGGPDAVPAGPDQDNADPLATIQPRPTQPRNETGLDIRV